MATELAFASDRPTSAPAEGADLWVPAMPLLNTAPTRVFRDIGMYADVVNQGCLMGGNRKIPPFDTP